MIYWSWDWIVKESSRSLGKINFKLTRLFGYYNVFGIKIIKKVNILAENHIFSNVFSQIKSIQISIYGTTQTCTIKVWSTRRWYFKSDLIHLPVPSLLWYSSTYDYKTHRLVFIITTELNLLLNSLKVGDDFLDTLWGVVVARPTCVHIS